MKDEHYYCPYCNFSTSDESKIQEHLFVKHNKTSSEYSRGDTPSFPVETKNTDSGDMSGGVAVALTKKQQLALRLYNENQNYTFVGEKMGISRQAASNLIRKASQKLGGLRFAKKTSKRGLRSNLGGLRSKKKHPINLHNDSIKIKVHVDWPKIPYDTVHLKHCSYKKYKDDAVHLKIYETGTMLIQFRQDIEEETRKKATGAARKRIEAFLRRFDHKGVRIPDNHIEQVSRHYAIIGTEVAKKYVREGKCMFIYDKTDGKLRTLIDFSDKEKKGGMPHLENVHVEKGEKDTDNQKRWIEEINEGYWYSPKETKGILDTILNVQKEYAYQIKKHLEVQQETLKTLKAIQRGIKR